MNVLKQYIIKNKRNRFLQFLLRCLFSNNLNKLAVLYDTDKWGVHWYTQHYAKHLGKFKNKKINILEFGVGGYDDPLLGGGSLQMWKAYFKKALIVSFDIFDKTKLQEKRIKIYQGSQTDEGFLKSLIDNQGPFDIIIDDGSHINEHVIKTFCFLFKYLNPGGVYAIEDTQTSYFTEKYGGSLDFVNGKTSINFFKKMADGLNYMEFPVEGYEPSYFERNITSIHFYHNLIIIHKGNNDELSYIVRNGKRVDL